MSYLSWRIALAINLAVAWAGGELASGAPEDNVERPPRRHALMVGCTKYELPSVLELWGPGNDVPLWGKLLVKDFDFRETDIRTLVGWTDDVKSRPTRANIGRAFEWLIEIAGPKDQVVIVMSGHGAQVPVPENNDFRKNPEPDGLDEVFLPADVKSWTPSGVENSIVDDEIGQWLDRLRSKGADVWIVFDCCHSGTMTRGGVSLERPRSVRPAELGIPDRVIKEAARRAFHRGPAGHRPWGRAASARRRRHGKPGRLLRGAAVRRVPGTPPA